MNVIAWIAITSRLLVQKENQEKVKELKRTLSFIIMKAAARQYLQATSNFKRAAKRHQEEPEGRQGGSGKGKRARGDYHDSHHVLVVLAWTSLSITSRLLVDCMNMLTQLALAQSC